MSDVSVREGRPEDGPALRRLAAETIGEPAAVRSALRPDPGDDVVFVAEVSGHPAGYAAVHVDGAMLVVDRVMVAPADRGRHVGHRLVDWLEGYAVSRGLVRVRIAVERDNRTAQEFYTRRGYAGCGDTVERDVPHV